MFLCTESMHLNGRYTASSQDGYHWEDFRPSHSLIPIHAKHRSISFEISRTSTDDILHAKPRRQGSRVL